MISSSWSQYKDLFYPKLQNFLIYFYKGYDVTYVTV